MYRRSPGRPCVSRRWQPGGVHWLDAVKRMSPGEFHVAAADSAIPWVDLSGNGKSATQTTADDQATLAQDGTTGDWYWDFDNDDGTNGDAFVSTANTFLSGAAAATLAVLARSSETANQYLFSCSGQNFALMFISTGVVRVHVGATTYGEGSTYGTGEDHLWTAVYSGAGADNAGKVQLYKDGVAVELTFTGTIPTTIPSSTGAAIGRRTAATYNALDGRIYTLAAFPRALSTSNLATMTSAIKRGFNCI